MEILLSHPTAVCQGSLNITGSKSETNRLLLLKALFSALTVNNPSNSDDSVAMKAALGTTNGTVDIHHAGTAMRFLTAYFSTLEGCDIVLTGSERMQERPIGVLVEALQALGAEIDYVKTKGYPPLRIKGKKLAGGSVQLPANISSQYISALLLCAPKLSNGLSLELIGQITSLPYIKMTLALLDRVGIPSTFEGQNIRIAASQEIKSQTQIVESDWSSASYYFSCLALSQQGRIVLNSYRQDSLQGDSVLPEIYAQLGVATSFTSEGMVLEKIKDFSLPEKVTLDLIEAPDIAQTIAVSCYGLGVGCALTGLHTLKIKETDRLVALETELSKLGAKIEVTEDSLHLQGETNFIENQSIATYHDHRMAMAFAPLAQKVPLTILDAGVVTKSYPDFWDDMQNIGFQLNEK